MLQHVRCHAARKSEFPSGNLVALAVRIALNLKAEGAEKHAHTLSRCQITKYNGLVPPSAAQLKRKHLPQSEERRGECSPIMYVTPRHTTP